MCVIPTLFALLLRRLPAAEHDPDLDGGEQPVSGIELLCHSEVSRSRGMTQICSSDYP
jgi:hypothetical protein